MAAPVAIFCYKRPLHLRQTVEALQANTLAKNTDVIFYSDGPKDPSDIPHVVEVRKYLLDLTGFKSITIKLSEHNQGLANSIINGVTETLKQYGRIIVIEDDIVLSPKALEYFQKCLDKYAFKTKVYSISGFNYPNFQVPVSYTDDVYFIPRMQCWGWATWRDRWEKADFTMAGYKKFISNSNEVKRYNEQIGSNSLSTLKSCVEHGKDVWACRWVYTHFKNNALCVCPVISYVDNIGLDGSGENCGTTSWNTNKCLNNNSNPRLPSTISVNEHIFNEFMPKAVPGWPANRSEKGNFFITLVSNILHKIKGKIF